jgi:ParB family transcriptional regulator, chromosome partitioning protein
MKRGGLGRGLSALIPGAVDDGAGMIEIPVGAIAPNPRQPRTNFDDETLRSLAASIREVGVLQPIVVRRNADAYELIAGERRLRAAKLAGLATVPVILRDSEDTDSLREALIENIHRDDLGPIELAEAFRELLDELGLKQETLAERLGVSRSHIANTIRLLQLAVDVQALLSERRLQAGHGRALLSLNDAEAQSTLALRAAAEDLSVREVEELVRRYVEQPTPTTPLPEPASPPPTDAAMTEVEEILSEQLATRVSIQMGRKRGRIVVEFGSADDLERIVSEIIGSGPGLAPE